MTTHDMEIVSTLRKSLADKVGKDRYEVWFGPNTNLAVHNGTLLIEAANPFVQDLLRSQFRHELEASCRETFGHLLPLEFRVDAELGLEAQGKPQGEAAPPELPVALPIQPRAEHSTRRKFESLNSFVVGPSNCLAHTSAQMAADQPGKLTPLFVHGATGVGKTHLLEGIWGTFKKAHRSSSAIYLSAEQFTTYFLEALHGSGLPSFRRKYRDVGLLIIDDVQFFAGKRATLVELLHTIDTLLREGRQLVFAADRSLASLKTLGPELAARLSGGMTCRIEPPEYPTRLGIVRQLAAKMGLHVPDEVQAFVASHLTTQARELSGALKRLQATSLALARPITLGLAEEALAELIHQSAQMIRLPDIERAVCDVFGLDAASLRSERKGKAVAYPRMLAMWLARKHTRSALSEIGHFFGRRTHSTVISAQRKVEGWMSKGQPLEVLHKRCNLEDIIRRVEEKMRVG